MSLSSLRPPSRAELNKQSVADVDPAVAEEEKKARLAMKVDAWKKKKLMKEMQEGKHIGAADSPSGTSAASPGLMSASSTEPQSPARDTAAPAVPYAGKFDHKAIAKRAAAALEKRKAALGGDVVIPKSANETSNKPSSTVADISKAAPTRPVGGECSLPMMSESEVLTNHEGSAPLDAKFTGFGLNKAQAEASKDVPMTGSKAAAPLDEDEEVQRKLEKLPDMPAQFDTGDAALANVVDYQDEGEGIRSDEEEAEAAREAALKRAEQAQAEQQDVAMADVAAAPPTQQVTADFEPEKMEEDEEVDPLDAFMSGLTQPAETTGPNLAIGKGKKQQPQIFNSDDEEADLDAIGTGAEDIFALAAKRKKREMPTVDHTKAEYEPFRKNFYSESVELSDMTEEDVDMLRADLDNIKCRGVDVPKPIVTWSQGGFGTQILDVIREQKFDKPTAIQSQALPAIMSGRDVIGVAKTGSGKTLAFLLPMFRHIKDQRPLENLDGPIGLILAPTRELATQIHRDCKPYLKALNLRAVCAYGGAPIKDQIAELKRGAEIVVCTPGRLIDLLAANVGRVTNLRRVTYVVLDEADRMFDMGFEPQMQKILGNIRPQRQTVLFSATFPRNMEALARKALNKPIEIMVGGRSIVAPEITQIIEVRAENTKMRQLLKYLGDLHGDDDDVRSLVFVDRQETADRLLSELWKYNYPTVSIHGGRDQSDRDDAIADFKNGVVPLLIATSVAARGLDVKQLKLVVNYDSPNHGEDYVHRCGRTGRAGNKGTAVTFVTPEQDRFAPFLVKALTDANQPVPDDLQKLKDAFDVKVKAGQAKKSGSGFGGHGIERLEAVRDAKLAVQKKSHKTGDEPDDDDDEAEKKKDDAKSKADNMIAKAIGAVRDRDAMQDVVSQQSGDIIPVSLADHLENAMKVQKAEVAPPPTFNPNDPLAKLHARAASINNRLGTKGVYRQPNAASNRLTSRAGATRPGVPIDNRGPDAGAFHATLEINDFPQKARWSVTNRTNVAKILEATGTSITTKGTFYAKGKEPEAGGMPKLYILVEGDTEVLVENAMKELTRLLKEGTIMAMESEGRQGTSGRYSVV